MVQTLECINCGHWYTPRKDGAPCPQCGKDPLTVGPGKGWKKGKKRIGGGWK